MKKERRNITQYVVVIGYVVFGLRDRSCSILRDRLLPIRCIRDST